MDIVRQVKRALGDGRSPEAFRECRHCGTSVADVDRSCPACGSREIASYRLE